MESVDFYIYMVISLIGVAYPLLLQVIARLDNKYSSDNIVNLFYEETESKGFKYLLYSSLIFIFIWTLKREPLEQFNFFPINHSATILVAINVIVLIVFFFLFIRKTIIYYTPTKFIQYLMLKHSKSKNNFKYFKALSDIFLLSIKSQQRNLSLTLSEFFYTAFKNEREKCQSKPVVYPALYYEIVYKSIEELAILKEKRNYALEYRTAGGIWLLGELQEYEISKETYLWIWRNILLMTQYEQEDMIVSHWETAHQYYTYNLQQIFPEYDYSRGNCQVKNKKEVEKRDIERKKFIEFHYALGGLLLYKQMYNCIKRLFSHTMNQPPTYELLPETMDDIFNCSFTMPNHYDIKYFWISSIYPFPKQSSGLNSDEVVKKWISLYMALLFLRQYTISLIYPKVPETQGEIRRWIDGIDSFKETVSEHLNNENLLKELNLTFITQDWCSKNNKHYPIDFLNGFKEQLQKAYNYNAVNLSISNEKITQFENSTNQIFKDMFAKYSRLNNPKDIEEDSDKWFMSGQRMLQSKDAFSKNSEVHHMNFDSILASLLSETIKERIPYTFLLKKTKTYLLKPNDIFSAIDKLKINKQFLIICFGVNLDYFINNLKIQKLTKEKYRNVQILTYSRTRYFDSSFFILKRDDLPNIITRKATPDIIEKYSLKEINEKLNLYTSVIDLNNTTSEIFNEHKQNKEEDELKKQALVNIIMPIEIKWRKEIEMIQMTEYSEYRQQGIPDNLDEVKSIKKH